MIDTRVVEEARVRAAVKSAHMRALKARLRRKKTARNRYSMGRFGVDRCRKWAKEVEIEVVRAVVVLRETF